MQRNRSTGLAVASWEWCWLSGIALYQGMVGMLLNRYNVWWLNYSTVTMCRDWIMFSQKLTRLQWIHSCQVKTKWWNVMIRIWLI